MSDKSTLYITRKNDLLFEGEREFRFASVNIPNLHVNEDPLPNWHRVDEWEIRDAYKTLQQLGATVTRIYTFSIRGGIRPGDTGIAHVYGPYEYEEQLFKDLDLVLELAEEYGIRIIIPFIDQWEWFGGIAQFAALRGKPANAFWNDHEIIDDFKRLITFVVNRVNTRTGIAYKDNPTIMAWETGNELDSPDEWTKEIVEHIRSLDSNHLIIDGRYGVSPAMVEHSAVDIVSNHYYVDRGADFLERLKADISASRGRKPFLLGEIGHADPAVLKAVLDEAVLNGTAGVLLWSLRYHNKEGGFYYQGDPNDPDNHGFNWPGFASRGSNEKQKLNDLRQTAFRIRGIEVPVLPCPEAPELLLPADSGVISWRGSVGAEYYRLERAGSGLPDGEWTVLEEHLVEDVVPFVPYNDVNAPAGVSYYRLCAVNHTGRSDYSNVVSIQR